MIVVALTVVAWLIADSILSKGYVMPVMSERTKIFNKGDIDDIKEFLKRPGASVVMDNYYTLIDRNRPDIMEMMFKEFKLNPDMNFKDKDDTPLLYSSSEFKPEIVSVLVKYGADVNYKDPYGMTPLIAASDITHEHQKAKSLEITKMLVEAGADVDVMTKYGESAIGGALSGIYDEMDRVKYLVESEANLSVVDFGGSNYMFYCSSIECYEYFISLGIAINELNIDGINVLQTSQYTRNKDLSIVNKLLELGADICHKDNEGDTVLNYVERQNTGPHDKKEKPEYYQKRLTENRETETYKYLQQKYQESCLE